MAGSEDRNPPDEDNEWTDFSSNSSKSDTFDSLPSGLRSLDPISVITTLIECFPQQSNSRTLSDRSLDEESSKSVADNR